MASLLSASVVAKARAGPLYKKYTLEKEKEKKEEEKRGGGGGGDLKKQQQKNTHNTTQINIKMEFVQAAGDRRYEFLEHCS